MPSQAIRSRWTTTLIALMGLVVGVLGGVLMAAPAQAHSALVSSDPADGSSLATAPTQVSFTFNESLLAEGNAITVTDIASDSQLKVGPLEVDGQTVAVTWPDASPAGQFRAAYRVVSTDGHPIDGAISFTVEQASGTPESTGPAAVSNPVAIAGSAPASTSPVQSTDPADSPSPEASSTSDPGATDDGGSGLLVGILALGAAIVIGALGGTWFMRRTR